MRGNSDLLELIGRVIYSSYVKHEKPVSLLLISDRPEAGKTESVKLFNDNTGIAYVTDLTAFSLWKDYYRQIQEGRVRHFVIPEFETPLKKARPVADGLTAAFRSLTEEGVAEIHSGFLKEPIKLESPHVVGLIACMSRPFFNKRRGEWLEDGFLSRFLVASYSYSGDTTKEILESIVNEETHSPVNLTLPSSNINVRCPKEISNMGLNLAQKVNRRYIEARKMYGFRATKIIIRLLKATALYHGRDTVKKSDFDEVSELSYLFNEDFNELRK